MTVSEAEPEDVLESPESKTGMNVSFTGHQYHSGIILLITKIH
jgi:hypothetical protein